MKTLLSFVGAIFAASSVMAAPAKYRQRLPQDEVIYFVLPDRFENGDIANDRGGLSGDRLTTGFDPAAKGTGRLGLAGIQERIEIVGGTLEIESDAGSGATILARIPLGQVP